METDSAATVELPLVLYKEHLVKVFGKSDRTLERLDRAGRLPPRLPLPGRPCWSRDVVLRWLSGRR